MHTTGWVESYGDADGRFYHRTILNIGFIAEAICHYTYGEPGIAR